MVPFLTLTSLLPTGFLTDSCDFDYATKIEFTAKSRTTLLVRGDLFIWEELSASILFDEKQIL